MNRIEKIEKNSKQFITEEIIKVPNENGGFDVYGKGQLKIGEEKAASDGGQMMLEP